MEPRRSASDREHRARRARGDVSLLFVFFLLTILLLGAMVVAVLAPISLKGAGNVAATLQAFYAADAAIERGYFDYEWDVNGPGDPPTCTVAQDVEFWGGSGSRYDVTVSGDPAPTGSCPTVGQLSAGRALCATGLGKTAAGAVQRRIFNDTNPVACRP